MSGWYTATQPLIAHETVSMCNYTNACSPKTLISCMFESLFSRSDISFPSLFLLVETFCFPRRRKLAQAPDDVSKYGYMVHKLACTVS